jgi:hypothetical protein
LEGPDLYRAFRVLRLLLAPEDSFGTVSPTRVGWGEMPNRSAEEYLALAQEAEGAAERLKGVDDGIAVDCWLAIAKEYRELAALKLRQMQERRASSAE